MEEKRQDLRAEQQNKLLQRLLGEVSALDPNLYYQSTAQIAAVLKDYIKEDAKLNQDELALLAPLSRHDIQIKLSLHE